MQEQSPVKEIKPRRSHCKSRNGCYSCKKRRVKCDEIQPVCGPCTKRQMPCSFQSNLKNSPSSNFSDTSHEFISYEDQISFEQILLEEFEMDLSPKCRILELKLLHHFCTKTCHSISIIPHDHSIVQCHIPDLAFSYPFLMDSIFALSALHLESLGLNKRKSWLKIALKYQNRTLKRFSTALPKINRQNCNAVAVCAMHINLSALVVPAITEENLLPDLLTELMSKRSLTRGLLTILTDYKEDLKNGPIKEWFSVVLDAQEVRVAQSQSIIKAAARRFSLGQLNTINSLLTSLASLAIYIQNQTIMNKETLVGACKLLENCIIGLSPQTTLIDAICWFSTIDIELISPYNQDNTPRLLFLHFGVVLHLINDQWYAAGLGKRVIRSLILHIKSPSTEDFSKMIQWACDTVGI